MFARPLLILAAFFWTVSSWATSFLKGSAQKWTELSPAQRQGEQGDYFTSFTSATPVYTSQ